MIIRNLRWSLLAVVMLAACSSGRNEALKSEPPEASTVKPSVQDSGPSAEQHREAYTPPVPPKARPDAGSSRCGPDEMDCCGACIHKSEKRCPENIHCPPALPEM
jgi:hypothetical protein